MLLFFHRQEKLFINHKFYPSASVFGVHDMTLSLCICTLLHSRSDVLFILSVSFTNRVIYLVYCFYVAPRSAV